MLLALISTAPLSWILPLHFAVTYETTPVTGSEVNGNSHFQAVCAAGSGRACR
jgi:hypothetical protein